jgi:hypothetical protein
MPRNQCEKAGGKQNLLRALVAISTCPVTDQWLFCDDSTHRLKLSITNLI